MMGNMKKCENDDKICFNIGDLVKIKHNNQIVKVGKIHKTSINPLFFSVAFVKPESESVSDESIIYLITAQPKMFNELFNECKKLEKISDNVKIGQKFRHKLTDSVIEIGEECRAITTVGTVTRLYNSYEEFLKYYDPIVEPVKKLSDVLKYGLKIRSKMSNQVYHCCTEFNKYYPPHTSYEISFLIAHYNDSLENFLKYFEIIEN